MTSQSGHGFLSIFFGGNVENFYVLNIGFNLFEISKQVLRFENFI